MVDDGFRKVILGDEGHPHHAAGMAGDNRYRLACSTSENTEAADWDVMITNM